MALIILVTGLVSFDGKNRVLFCRNAVMVYLLIGLAMSRWIYRAVQEVLKLQQTNTSHIGYDMKWVASRLFPLLFGGINATGGVLLSITIGSFFLLIISKKVDFWKSKNNLNLRLLTFLLISGFTLSFLYIFALGGGVAKWVYFSALAPSLICWATWVWHTFLTSSSSKFYKPAMLASSILLMGLLLYPAIQTVRIEGKPTPYYALRSWLDTNLAPGDTALIDRWYEPWNEMKLYAPSNVFVSFTVPDEPLENYLKFNWRKVTQTAIENNEAQAFIRICRNHEKELGLWRWPEFWFTHRAVVTNTSAIWLRDSGFAPQEEFYKAASRMEIEIFYDTHQDIANRSKTNGPPNLVFFSGGWQVYKPWQQGDWNDYHVLPPNKQAKLEIWNVTDRIQAARLNINAIASGGSVSLRLNNTPPVIFPGNRRSSKEVPVELPPGPSSYSVQNSSRTGTLAIRHIEVSTGSNPF